VTTIKKKLQAGEVCIGSWLSLGSLETAEMMTRLGFDWIAIDMEHTGLGSSDLLNLIRVISMSGTAALVRVGANDPFMIKRALEAGAQGIIVPMVSTPEQAEAAVSAASYPPRGTRGVGLFRAQDYGLGFAEYKPWADENIFVAVQIEHRDALPRLREILAVDGVDAFFIGPYDFSGSYGRPGDFDHPEVAAGLSEIQAVVKEGVRPASGIHVVEPEHARLQKAIADGHRFIAFGSDMLIFAHALKAHADTLNLKR
jgi:2-keto-3-deoxy-L-rhamnonate aldolase RhmA